MDSQAADTLTFRCPACDTSLRVPSSLAGVRGPCPQCRVEINAPQPPANTGAPPHRSTGIPGPLPVKEPVEDPDHEDHLLSSEPEGILTPQRQSIPSRLPPAEPEQSVIRPPASRDNLHNHSSLGTPALDPVANDMPLPSEQLPDQPQKKQRAASQSSSQNSAKRHINLHPLSMILIMLLSAGAGAVAMLMINRANHPTLALPSVPFLDFSAVRENPERSPALPQGVVSTRNNPPPAKSAIKPVIAPPSPAPRDPIAKQAAIPPPLPVPEPQKQTPPPATGVEAARKVLDAFLAANNVAERIRHVQTPDFVTPKMEFYYSKYPLKLTVTSIKHEVSSPVPQSNRQFHIFELTTPQHPSGFPVSVEETQHGCLVDWTSFVQFHDNLLGKFIRIYQPQPDTFHAILERAHYFRSDIPELGSKFCFRIKPPVPGYEGYAFINHGSPLADRIEQKFKWDKIYFPVLELQWTRTPDGARYMEIKDIVQDNWRAIQ